MNARTATIAAALVLLALAGVFSLSPRRSVDSRTQSAGIGGYDAVGNARRGPAKLATEAPPAADAASFTDFARAPESAPAVPALPGQGSATVSDSAVIPSMIIRVGDASIQVDSLEPAVAQVRQLVLQLGGYVANTTLQGGITQVRSATLTLKIPPSRYEDAVAGLRPLGDVEAVNTNAEDVGEEFVDLTARAENSRRLESRLISLLATRTGKLDDVLAVERELARVREQIERVEGRMRFLRSRVAMSTLTITVHEAAPLIGHDPSANVLTEAFKNAWKNFVSFVAALIASLGMIVPLGLLAGGVALTARRFWPRTAEPSKNSEGSSPAAA